MAESTSGGSGAARAVAGPALRTGAGAGAAAGGGAAGGTGASGTRLRPMAVADLPDVIALEHELFPDDPWSADMFADEVAQPAENRLYLLAETRAPGTRGPETQAGAPAAGARAGEARAAEAQAAGARAGEARAGEARAAGSGTAAAGACVAQPVMTGYAGLMFVPGGRAARPASSARGPCPRGPCPRGPCP